ncbi:MAG: DUF3631 domain-containing protein [Kineosporiaceae bacterium]
MLREYDIRSRTIRFPVGQAKGYRRMEFVDAWQRYAPREPDSGDADESAGGAGRPSHARPPNGADQLDLGGGNVPAVPGVALHVNTGTPPHGGTGRPVPPRAPVPATRSENELATHGTATATPSPTASPAGLVPLSACRVCHQPMTYDDGTATHPTCTTDSADRRATR